ncbi:hypothetical protein MRS44_012130 [Fusarium solani]|uniref:uncharacterized protein n=1 Tax=Fusarium solani TaxID=169388 RepID=UPI0032C493EC|nr:hypothetical protein MRS44_012130 [Fusarium solani]
MRARRRAIVPSIVAAVRLMLSEQSSFNDERGRLHEPPEITDEDLLDEYLRGHQRGLRLGLRRGQERAYREDMAMGFAYGLGQGQKEAYDAGLEDGLASRE